MEVAMESSPSLFESYGFVAWIASVCFTCECSAAVGDWRRVVDDVVFSLGGILL
jgi:hypothetical protein